MVIRDAGGGRHRSAAGTMASSSSAYRSTGSKSIKTTDTRSTRLVRITQTGLKKTRRSGKTKSEGEQPTKSILMKKKSGGLLRRKETKIARSVTFKDEVVNEYSNGDDYSTIASERTYSSAESSRSGSTKSLSSRVRSPQRRQPTLDPIEEGGETPSQERDPPEPAQSSGNDDAFFHLGTLPAIKGWSPQDFSMPTFYDATRNMNSWFNAHTSSNRAVNEAVPVIVPCSSTAAAASIVPSPTNTNDRPKGLISTPSSTSSVGLNVENEVSVASAPTITTHEEPEASVPPNTVPTGKPPLHPTSAPRCPPSPTRSIVTPAEPKYGNFQSDASLQESIEVSEATPKAGNAVTYHSSPGISLSSGSGASDATPTIGHTPLVIEVPSIIISNESNGEGGDLDAIEVASIPSLGGSSDAMSNASNQNSQNSPPSLEEDPSVPSDQGSYVSQTPTDIAPSDAQSSKTSDSGDGGSLASLSMSVEEKISTSTFTHSTVSRLIESANTVEKRAQTRERTQETTERSSPQANENEESSSVGPKNTMEIIKQMDKPSRQNQHKRSISLPKYFDRSQQYAPLTAAAESKVRNEPIKSGHSTSDTIAPNGANNNSAAIAQVIKEAKETSAESIINIHVHLNSNEVRPVTNVTSSGAPAVAEAPLSPEREATGSEEKKNDEEKATVSVSTGDNFSREEHDEADELQTSAEEVKETEVPQVEIVESVEMDMDELALLSTKQCIMECRDPLSPQNPDPVIKKPRRQPRKSAGCATILSNGAAKCIRHCAGVDEPHGCQLFSNIFSCANEAGVLGDIDWDSDESDDSTAQHRERQVKRSKHKKKNKHRPTREKREKEEDPSVVFDSGGLSFRLAVDLPGSDEISNDGPSQVDDESRRREDNESRDSDWEQDTIVMRRDDSSSIDSEDGKSRTTRESRQRQHHHRHKKSSSSHPDRSRRSRSRSRSVSRSKRDQSTSRSRSRSRSRSKSGARKERRRKDSNAGAHAHRNHRHPREESNRATHNRKVPPARPPALDERPLSPKRKRSMKDRLRHRSHSRR